MREFSPEYKGHNKGFPVSIPRLKWNEGIEQPAPVTPVQNTRGENPGKRMREWLNESTNSKEEKGLNST